MKSKLFIIILFLFPVFVSAQEYFTGCLLDEEAYNSLPQKKENLTRDYEILLSSYSLKEYCPVPNCQSCCEGCQYGTCTAWASAYAARTIAEAIAYGWKDKEKITQESFSPIYIYVKIKEIIDNCQSGTYIHKALEVMKNEGVAKYNNFNVLCASSVPYSLRDEASRYKIDDYYTLFYSNSSYSRKINETKKAISKDKPAIIAMKCFSSFHNATDIWNGRTDYERGYHAMCVIGYDDNKNGGSFQLMNSWGLGWGNGGFTWVTYNDYSKNVDEAYTIYVKKKELPKPQPEPKPQPVPPNPKPIQLVNLGGEIHYHLTAEGKKGDEMYAQLHTEKTIPYYRMKKVYGAGSRFRIYISNNEPAYVYVIGSDLKNSVSLVFPPDNKISALIDKSSDIAIPDEKWFIEMDNTVGTDYVCVLYSESALPIHNIVKKTKEASGNFYDKIKFALSEDMISTKEINYRQDIIGFDVKGTKKTVVPVIVEIEKGHK